jgi:hypothetical protein
MDDDSEQLARFEEMGEETVRLYVQTFGFAILSRRLAIKWLAKRIKNQNGAMSPPT